MPKFKVRNLEYDALVQCRRSRTCSVPWIYLIYIYIPYLGVIEEKGVLCKYYKLQARSGKRENESTTTEIAEAVPLLRSRMAASVLQAGLLCINLRQISGSGDCIVLPLAVAISHPSCRVCALKASRVPAIYAALCLARIRRVLTSARTEAKLVTGRLQGRMWHL